MAAALTDLGLGDKIVGTFGPLKNAAGEPDSQVAGLDIGNDVTDVTGGGEYGSIDLEKAATLKPDLVVTSAYLKTTSGTSTTRPPRSSSSSRRSWS